MGMMRTAEGERLRAWRTGHGLSQAEAARVVAVEPNTWARWERGEREAPALAFQLTLALDRLWRYEPDYRAEYRTQRS